MGTDRGDAMKKSNLIERLEESDSEFENKVIEAKETREKQVNKIYRESDYDKFLETCREAENNQKLAIEKLESLKNVFHTIVNSLLDEEKASGPNREVTIKDNMIAGYKRRKNPELSLKQTLENDADILGCFSDKEKIEELEELFTDLRKAWSTEPETVKAPMTLNTVQSREFVYVLQYKSRYPEAPKKHFWKIGRKDSNIPGRPTIELQVSENETMRKTIGISNRMFTDEIPDLDEKKAKHKSRNASDFIVINNKLIEAAERINQELKEILDTLEEVQNKWMNNYPSSVAINEL